VEKAAITRHAKVSRCLTSLVPQVLHRPTNVCPFPWSERFDRIFRNEGVTGSNPVSSTDQSSFLAASRLAGLMILKGHAPQAAHKTPARSTSFLARCFLTRSYINQLRDCLAPISRFHRREGQHRRLTTSPTRTAVLFERLSPNEVVPIDPVMKRAGQVYSDWLQIRIWSGRGSEWIGGS
jgi:hypothetical protein